MNFQYYETLLDKSDKNLLYFIDKITPNFTKGELSIFLNDIEKKGISRNTKSSVVKGYIEIGGDIDTVGDLSKLKSIQLKQFYQIFISKELNDKRAIKWRFYQYLKYARGFAFESIHINITNKETEMIDFVIEMDNREIVFVACFQILELDNYMENINHVIEFSKKHGLYPNKVIIAASKSFRTIPITEAFLIENKTVISELWVEWVELNKPFNGEDLLTVSVDNKENTELAGFNFSSAQDLLDYIYETSNGGQISIFKHIGFFSETIQEEPPIELFWKGIMIKNT